MKDGKKTKSKEGKSSTKGVKKAVARQSGKKGGGAKDASKAAVAVKAGTVKAASVKAGSAKVPAGKGPGPESRAGSSAGRGEGGFSNPAVAAAFKRAVKKYPSALKRLTD